MILRIEQVDRAICEAIRKQIVRMGYLPDVTQFTTEEAYAAAKQQIVASGKQLIQVYGTGNYNSRGELTANKITIDRGEKVRGTLGGGMSYTEPDGNGGFTRYQVPEISHNQNYQITYVTNSALYDRLISQILLNALSGRKYLKGVSPEGTPLEAGFWLYWRAEVDQSGKDFIERIIRFAAVDLFLEDVTVLEEGIPAMREYSTEIVPAWE